MVLCQVAVRSFVPSEFPPIRDEAERAHYKRVFDNEHLVYKELQAEMDAVNKKLSDVDRELDELEEGSPAFLVRVYSSNISLLLF